MYIVSYSKAGAARKEIGQFFSLTEAEEKARTAGAIGIGRISGRDYVYDVDGREGDDRYAVWIETPRHG